MPTRFSPGEIISERRFTIYEEKIDKLPLSRYEKDLLKERWLDGMVRAQERMWRSYKYHRLLQLISKGSLPALITLAGLSELLSFPLEIKHQIQQWLLWGLPTLGSLSLAWDSSQNYEKDFEESRNLVSRLRREGENYLSLTSRYNHYRKNKQADYAKAFKDFSNRLDDIFTGEFLDDDDLLMTDRLDRLSQTDADDNVTQSDEDSGNKQSRQ